MSIFVCEHGSLHVRLHDKDGEIFAVGCLAQNEAVQFVDQIASDYQRGGSACGELH